MRKLYIIISILLFFPALSFAQSNRMTDEEIKNFEERCIEYIDAMQYGLEIIGDKHQPKEVKTHYKKNVLEFFMGRGEDYKTVKDGREIWQPAVQMFVSSVNRKEPKPTPMKEYLDRLENLLYSEVKITKAAACKISNFYPVPGNSDQYTATATYFQYFEGRTGDRIVYADETQKDVTIFITKVVDGSLGEFWDIKFGDVNVVETRKVR